MKNVLVVGSLNMDIVASVNELPTKGETVLATFMEKFSGGKGANQAIACSRFGAKTYMIGAVGEDDNGMILLDGLKSNDVDTTGIIINHNENTGMAWITVDREGQNAIVVVSGANGGLTKEDIDDHDGLFDDADIVLLQLEIPLETASYVIDKAHKKGCKIILNPAPGVKLDSDILSKVDIITPNESELDILISNSSDEDYVDKANRLLACGVKNVICTLGEKGALLINNNGHAMFPAESVNVVDTTGAGDCFNGVLAAQLAKDKGIEEAIKIAVKASSLSVTKKGAQSSMPIWQDVEV